MKQAIENWGKMPEQSEGGDHKYRQIWTTCPKSRDLFHLWQPPCKDVVSFNDFYPVSFPLDLFTHYKGTTRVHAAMMFQVCEQFDIPYNEERVNEVIASATYHFVQIMKSWMTVEFVNFQIKGLKTALQQLQVSILYAKGVERWKLEAVWAVAICELNMREALIKAM
jgi:hypothetical protein